ncbi:uncharacterized protein LOC125034769 [Penaeus chinensis]|uniref:uncharacterized protein LOC125034769 n=1 Tax=Penaeus chinensis TaxID=139456 RepID=UPI001FB7ADC2|nr:uncharacterized protein LOC125034769 [Penaeus chinensis]
MKREWQFIIWIAFALVALAMPTCVTSAAVAGTSSSFSSSSSGDMISSSSSSSSSSNAAALRQSVDTSGVRNGECAYMDPQGRSVKIRYTEYPDGRLEAEIPGEGPLQDPAGELARCREAVKETHRQVQDRIQQTQQALDRNRAFLRQVIDNFARRIPPFVDGQDALLAREMLP